MRGAAVAVVGAALVDQPVQLGQDPGRVGPGAGHQLVQQPGGAQREAASGQAQGDQVGGAHGRQGAARPVVGVGVPGVGEPRADQEVVVDRGEQVGRARHPGEVGADTGEDAVQAPRVVPQRSAHGPQHPVPVGGGPAVGHRGNAPHGRLDDRGDGAVAAGVAPGRVDGGLRDGRGEVAAAGRRYAVDGGAEVGPVQGVVGAQFAGDAEAGRGLGDALGDAGQVVGQLDEAAADVDAVQGAVEEGPQFFLEVEQGAGLGQGDAVRAVGQPLGLFQEAGPEEVPGVAAEGVGAGQPALVAAQSVGVGAQQQVPGGVGALGEPGVGRGPLGQPEDGGAAHGLVGVRPADDEGVAGAVADGEQQQRGAGAGGADAAQPGLSGMAGDEGGGPGTQLVHGRIAQEGRQGTPP